MDATAATPPVADGQATGDDAPLDVFAAKDKLAGIGVVRDPHPLLHELASRCPVHHGSISGKFGIVGTDNVIYPEDDQVVVLDFHGVERGFRDPETFSSRYVKPALTEVIGRTILEMDPPE